ncbi:hypothetical protein FOA52_008458 [Chlamydomonas sp. UWO 241]|nr:hypothetical protein FOA52_008458 [Chlamydomonas sp. UWO 241]
MSRPYYDPTVETTTTLRAHLAQHVLAKGFQLGSLIGVGAAAPTMALLSRSLSLPNALRTAGIASLVGTTATGALLVAKMQGMDRVGLEDRVLRLHYNEGQNRVDALSFWGSALGTGGAVAIARLGLVRMSTLHLMGGGAAGCAAAVLYHVATKPPKNLTMSMDIIKDQVTAK